MKLAVGRCITRFFFQLICNRPTYLIFYVIPYTKFALIIDPSLFNVLPISEHISQEF